MSDKPTSPAEAFRALPGHGVVTLAGPDAARFAQAQFMGDVDPLGDGHWQWNGWLTPKGRVLALFALLRFDAAQVWLLLPDADAGTLAADLRRLLFRSKLQVGVADTLHVSGAFDHATTAHGARLGSGTGDVVELDMRGEGGARCLRIGASGASPVDPAFERAWAATDLAHGLPRLAPGAAPRWTPQQLSLERLRAYSVRKGCYPGQEIVARTHFLGTAKRGLVRLTGSKALDVGAQVSQGDHDVGEIACVSTDPPQALAVLQSERGDAPLHAGGVALTVAPLLDGLAR
ncbi:MAG TPA: folate-binding protein [Luteimonas sp.]|nr:folate-binding protein [Luteimonas sp.]